MTTVLCMSGPPLPVLVSPPLFHLRDIKSQYVSKKTAFYLQSSANLGSLCYTCIGHKFSFPFPQIYYCFSVVIVELGKEKLTFLRASLFKVLPHDSKARRLFVTSGGLKKVQEIKAEPGSIFYALTSFSTCANLSPVLNVLSHTCGPSDSVYLRAVFPY